MASSAAPLKLYSYWRSSCSYRVRIVLALKGVRYDYAPVHLLGNMQHDPAFTAINPSHEVPALVVDGTTALTQSQGVSLRFGLEALKWLS